MQISISELLVQISWEIMGRRELLSLGNAESSNIHSTDYAAYYIRIVQTAVLRIISGGGVGGIQIQEFQNEFSSNKFA